MEHEQMMMELLEAAQQGIRKYLNSTRGSNAFGMTKPRISDEGILVEDRMGVRFKLTAKIDDNITLHGRGKK